jgi:RimJ/RimL family protein N-acetyltransferase
LEPRRRRLPDTVDASNADIVSERLTLRLLPAAFLEATLDGRRDEAERLLGLRIHPEWWTATALARMRLNDLSRDPEYAPWSLRAIALSATGVMIGHAGFHTSAGPSYLERWAAGGVEFGYTVYTPYRRRGYATETAQALIEWARRAHGVSRFVLTIAPDNEASQRIARKLGFRAVGVHVDVEDGIEDVYALRDDAPNAG